MKVSKEKEEIMLNHIANGIIKADKQGNIWRYKRYNKDIKPVIIGHRHRNGYNVVKLYAGRIQHRVLSHRIVWIYFNGLIPEGLEPNHINNIKHDNRLANLELTTRKQNCLHSFKFGRKTARGERAGNSTLKESDIISIRNIYKKGYVAYNQLSKLYNVCPSTISRIVKRNNWKHI